MTAEIAILNKTAVALAADSAVTVRTEKGPRFYRSENKLFALSKQHPVGIMIYNNTELSAMPWETIIKAYRSHLKDRSFAKLQEYSIDFFEFIQTHRNLFPGHVQNYVSHRILVRAFRGIKMAMEKKKSKVTEKDIKSHIDILEKNLSNLSLAQGFDSTYELSYADRHSKVIDAISNIAFDRKRFPKGYREQLRRIAAMMICRSEVWGSPTGVVIAGFGNDDFLPSLQNFEVELMIDWKLKRSSKEDVSINHAKQSHIVPFAQEEVMQTLLKGINPKYRNELMNGAFELVANYTQDVLAGIKELTTEQKKKYYRANYNPAIKRLEKYLDGLDKSFEQKAVEPVLHCLSVLPKDELASVAESLVRVTSFRQRIAQEDETVGGPVDVAVISKGDGFIWIHRKHYFTPEQNLPFVGANLMAQAR